ncbi:hypothetical protein BV22DRAFT_1108220 [Leucogyrophana mollusca]|uniref:Uncharacterized protein n=1 Tax=Leucogyrophana mollusca TaxID=85980 RepID=A0ACB8B024_9AGAM|nr:hypothetical protein BV22DRAFT_1108220 [Leucogyrophana mollusca]
MSTSRAASEPATRVFALWKQDGHYYSGTVHSQQSPSSTRYLIKFDDGTEDSVDISKMRQCQLMLGDNVILIEGNVKGKVVGVYQFDSDGVVQVQVDDGANLSTSDVEVQDLMIASRTLMSQWKERMLDAESIVPLIRPKMLQASPSPSKLSMLSAASVKGGGKSLSKTGFVITLSVGSRNPEQAKDGIMLDVKNKGGVVLDDWSSVFSMQGTHSSGNKRWVAAQKDLHWLMKDGVERVFLLSDDSNQKPKFLMALALGIPCVSVEWVRGPPKPDWQPFLLPAGFSDFLNARVSQLIDLDWGNSQEHLTEIMSNLAASKLFTDKSILCVGADFVPLPKTRKTPSVDGNKEASRSVPWIILAMGASRVEAVFDVKSASSKDLKVFDYVVVKDCDEAGKDLREADVTLVHVPWVKECLIAGRLLPISQR